MRREMGHRNATPNLLLLVGLPLILIFLAIIVLLVLVIVCYTSVKLWRRLRGTDADSNRGSSIFASVKLTTPPPPKLAYRMAASLGDTTEGARYPYYTVPHENRRHRPGLTEEQNVGASSQSPRGEQKASSDQTGTRRPKTLFSGLTYQQLKVNPL